MSCAAPESLFAVASFHIRSNRTLQLTNIILRLYPATMLCTPAFYCSFPSRSIPSSAIFFLSSFQREVSLVSGATKITEERLWSERRFRYSTGCADVGPAQNFASISKHSLSIWGLYTVVPTVPELLHPEGNLSETVDPREILSGYHTRRSVADSPGTCRRGDGSATGLIRCLGTTVYNPLRFGQNQKDPDVRLIRRSLEFGIEKWISLGSLHYEGLTE